jgi:hypothetical protein
MDYMKKFQFWLDNDYFDEKTKEELLAIRNNASEIEDRFYKDLEFGTGCSVKIRTPRCHRCRYQPYERLHRKKSIPGSC